jgi:hypothetical protein
MEVWWISWQLWVIRELICWGRQGYTSAGCLQCQ